MSWFKDRFEPRATAVESACQTCGRKMWLPVSKVARYKTCGGPCAFGVQKAAIAARARPCETCGREFTPRNNQLTKGHGRFCSQKCNTAFRDAAMAPDVQEKRKETRRRMEAAGQIRRYRGEENPRWMGGQKAYAKRRTESGKSAELLRRYRQKNPDAVREYSNRRQGRKLGRLPYGTLPRIRALQKNRCAICRKSIAKASHMDHIVPLARGGKHEATNIQFLCPPCNLAKSDRDPIKHMQSLGRLL